MDRRSTPLRVTRQRRFVDDKQERKVPSVLRTLPSSAGAGSAVGPRLAAIARQDQTAAAVTCAAASIGRAPRSSARCRAKPRRLQPQAAHKRPDERGAVAGKIAAAMAGGPTHGAGQFPDMTCIEAPLTRGRRASAFEGSADSLPQAVAVRSAARRSAALNLLKACSIGLRSRL